jgi:hypothetical protein
MINEKKSEIRNPKLETNFNDQNIQVPKLRISTLSFLYFFGYSVQFVSNFDIRISDLTIQCAGESGSGDSVRKGVSREATVGMWEFLG